MFYIGVWCWWQFGDTTDYMDTRFLTLLSCWILGLERSCSCSCHIVLLAFSSRICTRQPSRILLGAATFPDDSFIISLPCARGEAASTTRLSKKTGSLCGQNGKRRRGAVVLQHFSSRQVWLLQSCHAKFLLWYIHSSMLHNQDYDLLVFSSNIGTYSPSLPLARNPQ